MEEKGKQPDSGKILYCFFFVSIGSIYIAAAVFFSENNTVTAMIVFSILLLFNMIILEAYSKITEKNYARKGKNGIWAANSYDD